VVELGDLIGGGFDLLAEIWDWWPEGKAEKREEPQPVPAPEYHERPTGRAE